MSRAPFPCVYAEGAFKPLKRFAPLVAEQFGEGEIVLLEQVGERSEVSHKHEFAWLREAWSNLPEELAAKYPSPEFLRKAALIATGHCTVTDHVCGSRAEAQRWAENLRRELDSYAIVIVSEAVVRVLRARSQSRRAMNKAEFAASKEAVLGWVSNLLGVQPGELERAAA